MIAVTKSEIMSKAGMRRPVTISLRTRKRKVKVPMVNLSSGIGGGSPVS